MESHVWAISLLKEFNDFACFASYVKLFQSKAPLYLKLFLRNYFWVVRVLSLFWSADIVIKMFTSWCTGMVSENPHLSDCLIPMIFGLL